MNKNGSCLLMLVIISSVVLIYYTNSWYSTSLIESLSYKKYKYEKKFRLAESLYKYGLMICINNINILINQNNKSINIYNSAWPPNSSDYFGNFKIILIENDKIKIEVMLIEKSSNDIFKITSTLLVEELQENTKSKKKNLKKFTILDWYIN